MNSKISSEDSNANELVNEKMSDKERIILGSIGAGIVGVASYPFFLGYFDLLIREPDLAFFLG